MQTFYIQFLQQQWQSRFLKKNQYNSTTQQLFLFVYKSNK